MERKMFNVSNELNWVESEISRIENYIHYLQSGPISEDESYSKMAEQEIRQLVYFKDLLPYLCICESFQTIYEKMYGKSVAEKLFGLTGKNFINAIKIILNNQTNISPDIFIKALNGNQQENIKIDLNNSQIRLIGKNKDGLPYDIIFTFSSDGIAIYNKCKLSMQVNGQEVLLDCDIPETFSTDKITKKEKTKFILSKKPNVNSSLDIFEYAKVSNSISRMIGRVLTDDEKILLQKGEILHFNNSSIIFDKRSNSLILHMEDGETTTTKKYVLDETKDYFNIIYYKDEETCFSKIKPEQEAN